MKSCISWIPFRLQMMNSFRSKNEKFLHDWPKGGLRHVRVATCFRTLLLALVMAALLLLLDEIKDHIYLKSSPGCYLALILTLPDRQKREED